MFHEILCGEACIQLVVEIKQVTENQQDNMLTLFCQGSKPNNIKGTPTGTAICIAWRCGREIGHQTRPLGPNAGTADAAHEAIQLAAEFLLNSLLTLDNCNQVTIQSTDTTVARDCLKQGACDHHIQFKALSTSISNLLDAHPDLQINLSWLPATKGSK